MPTPNKRHTQFRQVDLLDKSIALRLSYEGPGIASVTNTVGAGPTTSFAFVVDGAADTSVNTSGAAAGTIASSEVANIGAFADLVNAETDGYWKCILVESIRSMSEISIGAKSSTVVGKAGLDFNWDISELDRIPACIGPEIEPVTFGDAEDRISSAQNFPGSVSNNVPERTSTLPSIPFDGEMNEIHVRPDSWARLERVTVTAGNGVTADPALNIYESSQDEDTLLLAIPLVEDTEYDQIFRDNQVVINQNTGRRLVIVITGTNFDAANMILRGSWGDRGEILSARNKL